MGSENDHKVFEAEIVGLIISVHLAKRQRAVNMNKLSIWIDNTSAITAADTATSGPAHYLFDFFHTLIIELHRSHPTSQITISWIPGHTGVEGNERADEEAKKAATGRLSFCRNLPTQLHKPLPRSQIATIRTYKNELDD